MNIENKIKAMNDSATLINEFCGLDNMSDDQKYRVSINVKHLDTMLATEELVAYSGDKSAYVNAVNLGKSKVA